MRTYLLLDITSAECAWKTEDAGWTARKIEDTGRTTHAAGWRASVVKKWLLVWKGVNVHQNTIKIISAYTFDEKIDLYHISMNIHFYGRLYNKRQAPIYRCVFFMPLWPEPGLSLRELVIPCIPSWWYKWIVELITMFQITQSILNHMTFWFFWYIIYMLRYKLYLDI